MKDQTQCLSQAISDTSAKVHDYFLEDHGVSSPGMPHLKRDAAYPENLLEDILRARSLNCDLESLGYPHFLVKLYRKAIHSRRVTC